MAIYCSSVLFHFLNLILVSILSRENISEKISKTIPCKKKSKELHTNQLNQTLISRQVMQKKAKQPQSKRKEAVL